MSNLAVVKRYEKTMREIEIARKRRTAERSMIFMGHPYKMKKKILRASFRSRGKDSVETREKVEYVTPIRGQLNSQIALQQSEDARKENTKHAGVGADATMSANQRATVILVNTKEPPRCNATKKEKSKKIKPLTSSREENKIIDKKIKRCLKRDQKKQKKIKLRQKKAVKELEKEIIKKEKMRKKEKKLIKMEKRSKKRAIKQRKTIEKIQRFHSKLETCSNQIGKCMKSALHVICGIGGLVLITIGLFTTAVSTAPIVIIGSFLSLIGMVGAALRLAICAESFKRKDNYRSETECKRWGERRIQNWDGICVHV